MACSLVASLASRMCDECVGHGEDGAVSWREGAEASLGDSSPCHADDGEQDIRPVLALSGQLPGQLDVVQHAQSTRCGSTSSALAPRSHHTSDGLRPPTIMCWQRRRSTTRNSCRTCWVCAQWRLRRRHSTTLRLTSSRCVLVSFARGPSRASPRDSEITCATAETRERGTSFNRLMRLVADQGHPRIALLVSLSSQALADPIAVLRCKSR